ncbi:DUF4064 domain-containing protein [Niallia sp. 03133]|uniref:DUF4064 domain-containing protein n=1 Tax=Niallia sp. 03133 TaxID=3458060 RepID=UPI004044761E
MKRTPEMVLGIIALVLQLLVIILGVFIALFIGIQFPEQLPQSSEIWYAWLVLGIHVLGFVLGLAALFILKKAPKKSGIILLLTGILMLILTLGATLIQSVLFIIVGIMCFVRKPVIKNAKEQLIN